MSQTVIIAIVASITMIASIIAVGFAFFSPSLERQERTNKRLKGVARADAGNAPTKANPLDKTKERRRQVEETIKKIEEQQQEAKKNITLQTQLQRAGLSLTPSNFWLISVFVGVLFSVVIFVLFSNLLLTVAVAFAATFGIPRWVIGYLARQRQRAFLTEFPNSIDVIVRGVEAGLPLNDCLNLISQEAPAPVGPEFARLVEAGKVGVPIEQALQSMHTRIPVPELNFFSIVLSIQSKTGGNLSEALRNLSEVLRGRKKLKAKIKAMSAEAKASAGIIGSLPPGVMIMVYLTSPDYMNILFTERLGNLMIAGGAIWMLMGVIIMKKMMNFKI